MSGTLFPAFQILLVDDEEAALVGFETVLRSGKITNLISCHDSREVMPILDREDVALVLLDLWMPNISGEELLAQVVGQHPDVSVIIITGVTDVETAVRCMKKGAVDYLVKPVEKRRLVTTVARTIELHNLRRENLLLKRGILSPRLENPEAFSEIVTNNGLMKAMFQYMEAIANSAQPVLVTGETGVGKELVARALHRLSGCEGEFVCVNLAGLDDNVVADTLFGHRRGAFTGADKKRSGLVERASGGTLFLDEIGDLSNASQVKLLRLLQEREYFPLGSDVARQTSARIIVATNVTSEEMQRSPDFRNDLYYRLRTHHVHVPPLRDRLDDLPLLLGHFLAEAASSLGKKTPRPPEELLAVLGSYHFPGNVRELQAIVFDAVSRHRSRMLSMEVFKRAVGLAETTSRPVTAEGRQKASFVFPDPLPTLRAMENMLVEQALARASGNQAVAARLLGISRQALNRRLKRRSSA